MFKGRDAIRDRPQLIREIHLGMISLIAQDEGALVSYFSFNDASDYPELELFTL